MWSLLRHVFEGTPKRLRQSIEDGTPLEPNPGVELNAVIAAVTGLSLEHESDVEFIFEELELIVRYRDVSKPVEAHKKHFGY